MDEHNDWAEQTKRTWAEVRCENLVHNMNALRAACDTCEEMTPQAEWPYPSYTDILFSVK